MQDKLNREIESGDLISYATRVGNSGCLKIGVASGIDKNDNQIVYSPGTKFDYETSSYKQYVRVSRLPLGDRITIVYTRIEWRQIPELYTIYKSCLDKARADL